MAEKDRWRTAFSTRLGHFQFRLMPFGLINSPATFARLAHTALSALLGSACFVCIDDLVVFSKTVEEHLTDIEHVLQRLYDAGLRVKLRKCELIKEKIQYLGHEVTETHMNESRVKAIANYPIPKPKR